MGIVFHQLKTVVGPFLVSTVQLPHGVVSCVGLPTGPCFETMVFRNYVSGPVDSADCHEILVCDDAVRACQNHSDTVSKYAVALAEGGE